MSSRTLPELLKRRAEAAPEALAILAPGRTPLTYRQLSAQVEATVAALRAYDLQQGDRVAVVLPNGPEMAVAFAGVAAGATCAPLNPAYRLQEFEFYLEDLRARAIVVDAEMDSPVREAAQHRGIPILELKRCPTREAGVFELSGALHAAGPVSMTAAPDDTALVLHTSGTTSKPKIVPLSQQNLCSSGHSIMTGLRLTEGDRCLNVMPLFHIHGLVGALLSSLTAGASVVATPGLDPLQFFAWLEEFAPTWYTAVPTMHQAILTGAAAQTAVIARRPLRFIRSCSAALPPRVMAELEERFATQVLEAYGMTEASHQIASNPLAPAPRKPGSVGVAAGATLAVMGEGGRLLPAGQTGEVVIKGPGVIHAYEGDAAASASSFTNGWFRTGDQGRLDSDGYLFLTGRLKELVNRGGEKIAPAEVDAVLTQHPAVSQAVAFGMPHPTLGEELAAAVVLRKDAAATERELRDFAAARLADFKVPRQLLIVDAIPKGPTGKLQRRRLAEAFADRLTPQTRSDFVAPHTSIQVRLAEIWASVLPGRRIGLRDDFYALGGDSLGLAVMTAAVEDHFKRRIPLDAFLGCPTIETLAGLLADGPASRGARVASGPFRDSLWSGLKNRVLQALALYAPGYKTTRVRFHRWRGVTIGRNVSIGLSALIETAYPRLVAIGNDVTIGMRVIVIGHLRDSTDQARAAGEPTVRIEDRAYIGPGVIILPHVTIGEGAVVAAGSVVTGSIPAHTLARGNPARPIARCGVSLGGGVSYEEFVRHLTPLDGEGAPAS
jgi:acyl-CoA synthetase (AMP-forming)/AMP-acid ligase II/acetyltransferase-like isoleucine patch superfamily enzyme/acyl carrier protein